MRESAAPPPRSRLAAAAAASASSCAPGFRRFIDFRFSPLQPPDTVIRAGPAGILSPHRPHTSVACPLSRTSNLSVRSGRRPPPASRWALSRRPEDGDGGAQGPWPRGPLPPGLVWVCCPREAGAGPGDVGLGDSQEGWGHARAAERT